MDTTFLRSTHRLGSAALLIGIAGIVGCAGAPSESLRAGPSGQATTHRNSGREPAASYMRVVHPDADTVSLQVALRSFVPMRSRGPEIWLMGASHVGESNYFASLQRHLDGMALVLFEGVGASSKRWQADAEEPSSLQYNLAASLGLAFQLRAINYDRAHFRNSDLTISQLQGLMRAGAETGGNQEGGEEFEQLLQVMDGSSFLGALLDVGLKFIASSPKLREMTKLVLIETLGGFQGDLAQVRGLPPGLQQLLNVIIQERDKAVLKDLAKEIRSPHPPPRVAVFYGAGHMADLERRLRSELEYRPHAQHWLTAISVNTRRAGLSPSEVETLRGLIRWQLEALQP